MRAEFLFVFSPAIVDAEEVGVRAIHAFTQGDAHLGHGNPAAAADGKELRRFGIVGALRTLERFEKTEDPAFIKSGIAGTAVLILFRQLGEVFVHPVVAASAV
jgi:hypothetical protein